MRVALLADTHVGHPGAWERLQLVGHWLDQGGADQAIVLGDVVHTASQAEYEQAKWFFYGRPIPVRLTTGNHELFCRELPVNRRIARFERYFQPVPASWLMAGYRFILLAVDREDPHSQEAWRDTGMTHEQLAWLNETLKTHPDQPAIVMSHAPLTGTVEGSDLFPMADSSILNELAGRYQQIKLWASAHTHYPDEHLGKPLATLVQRAHVTYLHCVPVANYYAFITNGQPLTYPLAPLEVRLLDCQPNKIEIWSMNPISGSGRKLLEVVLP